MGVIDRAVEWAVKIANDESHGYDQGNRWGPDYDCSSLVIQAYENAGTGVKTKGAYFTGNMYKVFTQCGFQDVINSINLSTGAGTKKGDVLLNTVHHTAMVVEDNGKSIVQASINEKGRTHGGQKGDQTGNEICLRSYYNKPWDHVLRYCGADAGGNGDYSTITEYTANWVERELPNLTTAQMATKVYERYQMIHSKDTVNYKLCYSSETKTNEYGFRIYKDKYYMIALGTYYGNAGTYVKIQFQDGTVIYAIMGDEKNDAHTDSKHMYHVVDGINFLEIIVDADVIKSQEQFLQQCDKTGIPSKVPVVKIWTSDSEPTYTESSSYEESDTAEEIQYNFSGTDTRMALHPSLFRAKGNIGVENGIIMLAAEKNITAYIGDLTWDNSIDQLATTMTFSLSKTDSKYNKEYVYYPQIGDIIRYGATSETFRGVIIDVDDGDRYINKYTAVDVGWYLNKSADTYQFTEQRADECIQYILNRKSVPIIEIPELSTKITQIYVDKALSDIIKDILALCGSDYTFDFVPDGIRIYRTGTHEAAPVYKPAKNLAEVSSVEFRGVESHKVSMENMITAAKVINDSDVLAVSQNAGTIEKYGYIQRIIKKSDNDNPIDLARETVKSGSSFEETYSFQIVENLADYTRAGDSITVSGIRYIVTGATHNIKNGMHYVGLELEKAEKISLYDDRISTVVVNTEKQEVSGNTDIKNTASIAGKKIIVLDPGHGKDSGSMSGDEKINSGYLYNSANGSWGEWRHFKNGTWGQECAGSECVGGSCWYPMGNGDREIEPEITLAHALAAKKYLEQMGYIVRMTRTSNSENPSFTQRAKKAFANGDSGNAPDAECIVCIHANSSPGVTGSAYVGLGSGYQQKYISTDYAQQSENLAKIINDRIVKQTSLSQHGSGRIDGQPNLILFHKSPVPVAYMEIGFYDTPSDLSILKSESDKIGRAIAEGVQDWLGGK